VSDLLRQLNQAVRLAAHSREDDNQIMTHLLRFGHALCDSMNSINAADRRAAVFLDNQGHRAFPLETA
jgi:hypothetical protein